MASNPGDRSPKDMEKELREKAQLLLLADHFTALGLQRTATTDAVSRAFVQAAKTWHPDRAPANEEMRALFGKVFARLDVARATLSDASRRQRYLEELGPGKKAGPSERPASAMDVSAAEAQLEYKKAEALLKKNDVLGAAGHLQRATQLAPNNATYQAVLISLQAQKANTTKEQLAKLASDLDQLIGIDPKCERAFFHRGQIRKRLDRLEEANADFKRAHELDPSNVDAAREVRIFEMRKKTASQPPPPPEGGAAGFFRKLWKR